MQQSEKQNFYVEDTVKLALLSYGSFGLYNVFYFYRNFKLDTKMRTTNGLVLIVKSFLYPLFCFRLIANAGVSKRGEFNASLISIVLVFTFILFVFSASIFTGNGKYFSLVTFLPLIMVNNIFSKANGVINRGALSLKEYTKLEKGVVFLGGPITSFILLNALI